MRVRGTTPRGTRSWMRWCEYRRGRGLPGVSLAWGPWDQSGGMAGELSAADRERMPRAGLPPLSVEQGVALFDAALGVGEPVVLPVRLDLSALRARGEVPPLLRGLIRTPPRGRGRAAATGLAAAAGRAGRGRAAGGAAGSGAGPGGGGARARGCRRRWIPSARSVISGFDSLTAVELRNGLSAATGLRLPATLVFDYPTVAGRWPSICWMSCWGGRPGVPVPVGVLPSVADEPVVIVGMACRFPGGVASPEDLWGLVSGGRGCGVGVSRPTGGGIWRGCSTRIRIMRGRRTTREGGFLHDAGEFDAGFFGMSSA